MNVLSKTLTLLVLLCCNQVHALGLGKETLHSTLNEKLFIELPVIGIQSDDRDRLKVSIASRERYQQMGVELTQDHLQFDFSVIEDSAGGLTLLVTSKNPINEPFINFVLEVSTPQGQLFREISVLLDTPR